MIFPSAFSIASAHQTQISDGVGGTHHIEPNDTPRAGEPSQAWFALTQAGGRAIGLSDCDCELVLYGAGEEAIASPALSAIAVEGLTDVPAAELVFPKVGAYILTLSGEPKDGATFSPFRLDFPITVAAGATATAETGASTDAEQEPAPPQANQPRDADRAKEDGQSRVNGSLLSLIALIALATAGLWAWKKYRGSIADR